jgi:hypothetical protein
MGYPSNRKAINLKGLPEDTRVQAKNGLIGVIDGFTPDRPRLVFKHYPDTDGRIVDLQSGTWEIDGRKTTFLDAWPPGMDIVKVL